MALTDLKKKRQRFNLGLKPADVRKELPVNLPGAENRNIIRTGQQVSRNIVTDKQLEQPTIKPTGGLKQADATKPERSSAFAEVVPKTKKVEPRKIGTSTLTEEGGVSRLVGSGTKARQPGPGIDFTRGTPTEVAVAKRARATARAKIGKGRGLRRKKSSPFNILNFEGIENIVSSAGELASLFASPKFQAGQRKARGLRARRKEKLANVKSLDNSIKAISSALEGVSFAPGTEELRTKLTGQLEGLLKQRANISGGGATQGPVDFSSPAQLFTSLEGKMSDEEREGLTRRVFPNG